MRRYSGCSTLGLAALLLVSCDAADYQRPIAEFQVASAVVTQSARDVFTNFNTIKRNAAIDRAVSRRDQIDIEKIRALEPISPSEIEVRIKALDTFQSYIATLAELAGGKAVQDISTQADSLSKALDGLSKSAAALPKSNANFIRNGDLGTSLTSLANVTGAIATLIAQHKAKKEIIKSVMETRKPVEEFTNLLEKEMVDCLSVQKTAVADEEVFYAKSYQDELRKTPPDAANLLVFGEHIKLYLLQRTAMESASPGLAFAAMRRTHAALVEFVREPHNPKNLGELFSSAQAFASEVKPFGQAIQSLGTLK